MKSKVHAKVDATSDARFFEGLQIIDESTSKLPTVAPKDKKGRKVNKNILPLIQKAIDSAPQLENHLKRDFTTQNLIDNKVAHDSNLAKVAELYKHIDRLLSANTCIGKEMDIDFRIIYAASQDAADEDVTLIPTRDTLGTPFKRTGGSEGKKGKKTPKMP